MDEALYYNVIALHIRGNYASLSSLFKKYGSWKGVFTKEWEAGADLLDPEKSWDKLVHAGIKLMLLGAAEYPAALAEIPHPPFGIYVRGEIPVLENAIAIVGTRRATPEGKHIAEEFAEALARKGCTIISGLAFGIDAAAHAGALRARGRTLAVLPGGLDAIYPRTHGKLAEKIIKEGGAIISEYPPGEVPYQSRFLERNRMVSGLSRGTVVIEAPKRSGAIATARFAFEQNRDLFVVPGSIAHPNFKGSHALIRQGAELVSDPAQILRAYNMEESASASFDEKNFSSEEILILQALQSIQAPLDVDKITTMTKLKSQIVNQTLSFLLIRNVIRETGTGYTI